MSYTIFFGVMFLTSKIRQFLKDRNEAEKLLEQIASEIANLPGNNIPYQVQKKFGYKFARIVWNGIINGDVFNEEDKFNVIDKLIHELNNNKLTNVVFDSDYIHKLTILIGTFIDTFFYNYMNNLLTNPYKLLNLDSYQNVIVLKGASIEDALKFTNKYQFRALSFEVSIEDALKFTNRYQVDALKAGASVEKAVQFIEQSQVNALRAGATVEHALEFRDSYVNSAIAKGVSAEEILKLTNIYQLFVLEKGVKIENVLNITEYSQYITFITAFNLGVLIEDTLKLTQDPQVNAIITAINEEASAEFTDIYQNELLTSIIGNVALGA